MLTALQGQTATKADLAELEGRIIKWVVGMAFAQIGAIVAIIKLFMH